MRIVRIPFLVFAMFVFFLIAGTAGTASAQTATTTALQQSSACLTSGCVTTLTATVTAGSKAVYPGFVYFCNRTDVSCENRVPLGMVPLSSNGTAALPIQLAIGNHALRAIFHGTKAYAASQSNALSLTISPGTTNANPGTITSISAIPVPTGYTLSSLVSSIQTASTGTVSFLDTSNHNAIVATAPLGAGAPSVIYGQSAPDFSHVSSSLFLYPSIFISGDFNQDGYQDLEIAESDGTYDLLLGNGKGVFTLSTAAHSSNAPYPLYPAYSSIPANATVIGDFNNDGIPDFAAISGGSEVDIYIGNGSGGYTQTSQPITTIPGDNQISASDVFIADFANRGVQDIVVGDGYSGLIYIFSGNGDGTFIKHPTVVPVSNSFVVGDFDGDGIPDIVTNNPADVTLYHGNGDFTFTKKTSQSVVPTGGILAGYLTGDFNGDGTLDLATVAATDSQAYASGMISPSILQTLFYNAQKASFDLGPALSSSSGTFVATGDLNSDGLPDFFLFNSLVAINAPYPPPPPVLFGTSTVVSATAITASPVMLAGATTHNVLASFPGDSLHTASASSTIPLLGSATDFPSGIDGQQGIAVNGSAAVQGNSIVLTDGKQFEAGSFFSSNRINVGSGFSTDFDFQLNNAVADGFAFVLQNNGPDAIGVNGGGLGYGSSPGSTTGGITNSLAIAFDLHNNLGEGSNSVRLESGGVTNGTGTDLTPSGINLHSGDPFHAEITYDANASTMTITVTDLNTKAAFSKSFSNPAIGSLGGGVAYPGFTGGTGNTSAVQTISNWVFTPTTNLGPSSTVPSYPTGFAGATDLHFNGGAAVSGNAINLTYGTGFEATSVYFSPLINLQSNPYEEPEPTSVPVDFDFQVVNGIGDGFTFVLQDAGLNSVGSTGGGLGYGPALPNQGGAAVPNSLAIKFDLHNNDGEGTDSTGVYTNGASPTVPAIDMSSSGIVLSSGHAFHVHLNLENDPELGSEVVTLTLTDLTKYKVFTTQSYLYFPLQTFYAGFTAGTGATPSNIKILNWTW